MHYLILKTHARTRTQAQAQRDFSLAYSLADTHTPTVERDDPGDER